jgi:hypothetical protein
MNERIKELAEQAETWNADGDKCEVDLEKFAELIVRECAQFTDSDIRKFILKHFGVEE